MVTLVSQQFSEQLKFKKLELQKQDAGVPVLEKVLQIYLTHNDRHWQRSQEKIKEWKLDLDDITTKDLFQLDEESKAGGSTYKSK